MKNKFFILIFTLTLGLGAQQKFSTGLKPDSFDVVSTLKEANPNFIKHRGLPSEVDLSPLMPPVGDQGQQGSCVAWSTAYANKSYHEFIERKESGTWKYTINGSPNPKTLFSPAFVYNQINGGRDNGSSIADAMALIVSRGAVTLDQMPYDVSNFTRQPSPEHLQFASKFKAKEYQRVRYNDPSEIKSQLSQGRPVVVGILVDEGFNELKGKEIYRSARGQSFGGHAITIVGYNDSTQAFKFQNSWSTNWGDKGFGYIDYKFFSKVCRSAFVMVDLIDPKVEVTKITPAGEDSPVVEPVVDNSTTPPGEINATKGNYPDKIVLSWKAVPGAIGYEVYRAYPEEDEYELVGLAATTYFEDTGIFPDTAYAYRLTSVTEFAVSEKSEGDVIGYASATRKTVPVKVSGLSASVGTFTDRVSLTWEAQENTNGYIVYKYDNTSGNYRIAGKVQTNQFEDRTARKNGIAEIYTVIAYNSSGNGEPANAVVGRTATLEKPSAPRNLYASMGQYRDRIELNWGKATGANDYVILKYEQFKWTPIGTTNKETFSDPNVSRGKKYYTVIARNSANSFGAFSNYAVGYANPNLDRGSTKLPPPQSLTVKYDSKAKIAQLKWEAVKNAEEYNIWYKKSGSSKWSFIERVEGTKTGFDVTVPEKNSFYLFSVTSKTLLGGDSEYSKPVTVVDSTPRQAVGRRSFLASNKLDQISGTWSALQWDGNTGVKNILLEVEAISSNEVSIKIDNKKTYTAKYIQQSPIIDFEGKIKIKLSSDDSLMVEFKDSAILKEKVELSFLRE